MNEIKSVVSVIKILERTIGILENCNDFGEIPDTTRKRVIELLNKATLEIYFANSAQESVSPDRQILNTDTAPEEYTPEIKTNVEIVPEEVDIVPEEVNVEDNIPEEKVEDIPPEEKYVSEEEIFEEENIIENIPEDNVVSEEYIFRQQDGFSDKPIIEWETQEPEPLPEPEPEPEPEPLPEPEPESAVIPQESKDDEINILKLQLEEERKRLEQELRNWQDEKRKKDEEILATKKLLDALQQQTAANQTQRVQPQQPKPQQAQTQQVPHIQQTQQVPHIQQTQQPQPVRQVQQPQQPVKTEPLIVKNEVVTREPVRKKEEAQEPATLIDSYIGSKKVLHENFESASMVNQISTPVSSLPRAIGINDRFRFIKELFGGDSDLYNETIKNLDTAGSLISAISYIESNFSWDKNSDSVKQLISLVRRRYM
jgi:hypothetical protein